MCLVMMAISLGLSTLKSCFLTFDFSSSSNTVFLGLSGAGPSNVCKKAYTDEKNLI